MKKKLLRLGFVALSVLVLTACQVGTKEYLSVSFKGYDGYGTATVSLDREELIAKLYGKDATDEEQDAVHDGVSVSVDGSEALSNGDKVKVTVDVDKESAVASKIKSETYTYDVSGLTETTEISSQDLVKKLAVTYTGISGQADYPEISIDSTILYPIGENGDDILKPSASNSTPISNGDMIAFSVEKAELAMNTGYVLTDDKEISLEVSGLDKIPDTVSEIKNLADLLAIAQEQAEKDFAEENLTSQYSLKRHHIFYRHDYQETKGWKNSYYGDLAIVYEYVNAKEDSFVKTSTDFYVYNFSKLIIDKDGIVTLEAPSELDKDKMVKLSAQSDHFYRDSIDDVYASLTNLEYRDVTTEVESAVNRW
ncbi:hypothetical protein HO969_04995 [Streptococcus suis]|uniref:Lipoprotein n=2 Tax=Streptococcus suis TaxID=1307 RepID=A0A0Z8GH88_STRSU|nr:MULTISPECIES: hypothetical protein [Streptococcus]MBM7136291.1 hypothetical protein [Streptococcus suis]MBY0731738.1 hypothetical protein [Streptococcus sp. 2018162]MCO8177374.1 hypothetical protein [Streptococcus suis]MCO8189590.1 hypothetical protein [Streptococcus suis]NQH22893.1 hypothetical protein [Streptococcus suis]